MYGSFKASPRIHASLIHHHITILAQFLSIIAHDEHFYWSRDVEIAVKSRLKHG